MRITRILLALALAAGLGITACSAPANKEEAASAETGAGAKTVKIGFAAPLTGDNAVYGTSMKRAVDLAVKEANASDEVKKAGYTFVVQPGDDVGDPKQAVNVANLLAGDTAVAGIVGHFNSGCSIPASKVYQSAGIAMISVSTNPQLTAQGFSVVNRIVAKDTEQGAFAADLVGKKLAMKKVAVIDDATAYGIGLADEFAKQFKAAGGDVPVREKIQAGEKDFSAVLTKIKATAPQAIYYGGAHTEGGLISKQAKDMGLSIPIVGGDMLDSAEYIKVATAKAAEGDVCTALGEPLEKQPKGKEFEAAYKAAYNGEAPGPYDSYAYDSAKAFIAAIVANGPDRQAVMTSVRGMEFDGVSGKFKFDSNGDTSNKAITAYKVVGGEWKLLEL